MVDTLASGASAVRHGGSSPLSRTKIKRWPLWVIYLFDMIIFTFIPSMEVRPASLRVAREYSDAICDCIREFSGSRNVTKSSLAQ